MTTTLQVPSFQIILRSQDGAGSNAQKTFHVNLRNILSPNFTTFNIRTKFLSTVGSFGNSWVEVRWNHSNLNQFDSSGVGHTLCFPKILIQVDNEGQMEGSVMMSDFSDSPSLLITPSTQNVSISVYDDQGNLLSDMTPWTLILECQPVTQRISRR